MNRILSIWIAILLLASVCPVAIASDAGLKTFTYTLNPDLTTDPYPNFAELFTTNSETEDVDIPALHDYFKGYLQSMSGSIPLRSFNIPLDRAVELIHYIGNMPEAFHAVPTYSYRAQGDYLYDVIVRYRYTAEEYAQKLAIINENAAWLLRDMSSSAMTNVEKALLLHDRVIAWMFYGFCGDESNTSICYTLEGPMLTHEGVCAGYAKLYNYLLREVGIESLYVSSKSLDHAWNILKINGQWYHVDTTWDDGGLSQDVVGRVEHDNFLLSTDGILATGHTATDFTTLPVSTTYDSAYWQDSLAEFVWLNNALYYIDHIGGGLYRTSGGSSQKLLTLNDSWGGWGITKTTARQGQVSIRKFYCLSGNSKYLYYSTPTQVIQLDPTNMGAAPVYAPTIASGSYLFGATVRDWLLTAQVGTNPVTITHTETVQLPHDYAVAYDANGGAGAPAEQTKINDQPLTLSTVTPARDHYTFLGWNTAPDGSGTDYQPGASYTANADITLYAQWRLYSCTIRFHGNGATGGPDSATQTLNYEEEAALNPNPYQRAYTVTYEYNGATGGNTVPSETAAAIFNGWAETPNGDVVYGNGQPVRNMIDQDLATVDFYANWKLRSVTLPTPTKTGYIFDGWYTDSALSQFLEMGGVVVTLTENIRLYASWLREPPVVSPAAGGVLVNKATHQIYGLRPGSTVDACLAVDGGAIVCDYSNPNGVMGTGTKVNVYDADQVLVDSYTVVVFGDVSGDGWYDGMDAYYLNLIVNGMIPKSVLSEAQYTACDANHDGAVDAADAKLVDRAGLLLSGVDQSANNEDLIVNSAYEEYCALIDQTAAETEPAGDAPETVEPVEQETPKQPAAAGAFDRLRAVFAAVLNWLRVLINVSAA